MNTIEVKPGDVVVSKFSGYQHWSLVTNVVCDKGKHMLISATKRNGTVQEEPWDIVTEGKPSYVAKAEYTKSIDEVLTAARSQINQWDYSLTERNCEHFVKWASGLKVSSTQVKAGVGGAAVGVALVGALLEKPNLLKFLGGALIVGALAVGSAKALEKEPD